MEFKLKKLAHSVNVSRIANIHYFEFTKSYHTFEDKHSFRELVYIDNGLIEVRSDGYSGTLREGQMLIHKSDEIHSLFCPDDNAANVIIIGFECKCQKLDVFSSAPIFLNDIQKKFLAEVIKEGRNVFSPPYDVPNTMDMKKRKDCPFGSEQLLKLKLENLFIELIRVNENISNDEKSEFPDDKIQEIRRYIDENFREKITLSELCFLFGTNKTTLCTSFKNYYNETIIHYINRLKIKEAKNLLRGSSYNLTEISNIVGFSSVHYFSRIFKQYENQSPTSYLNTVKSRLLM